MSKIIKKLEFECKNCGKINKFYIKIPTFFFNLMRLILIIGVSIYIGTLLKNGGWDEKSSSPPQNR